MTPHGTVTGYTSHKCRCAKCRGAWLEYWQDLHEQRKRGGLCLRCSQPLQGDHVRCFDCRRREAEAKRRYRAREKAKLMGHPAGADLP